MRHIKKLIFVIMMIAMITVTPIIASATEYIVEGDSASTVAKSGTTSNTNKYTSYTYYTQPVSYDAAYYRATPGSSVYISYHSGPYASPYSTYGYGSYYNYNSWYGYGYLNGAYYAPVNYVYASYGCHPGYYSYYPNPQMYYSAYVPNSVYVLQDGQISSTCVGYGC